MKFRSKPKIIEAMQLRWDNWSEMCDFAGVGYLADGKPQGFNPNGDSKLLGLRIPTLEGTMEAHEMDWIIRGIKGELYPCKPDIFAASYEPIEETATRKESEAVPRDPTLAKKTKKPKRGKKARKTAKKR